MAPISSKKFDELTEKYGKETLAHDLKFLCDRGLVHPSAVVFGTDGGKTFNIGRIALTADGVDFANADSIGNELRVTTIKIHDSTLKNIENIIKSAELSNKQKASLLSLVKDKGAEAVVGKCVEMVFANAGLATAALKEALASFF
ncbi:MAG: hypothetical protein EKE20_17875 [Candidatus Symbiopectobacterium sp. Dall1.0]|nr:hypothetical protein [Candidatus Symbiopectobacterium sp. Dall1.0]